MEAGGSELAGIKDQLLYSWVGAEAASPVTLPPPGGSGCTCPLCPAIQPSRNCLMSGPTQHGPGARMPGVWGMGWGACPSLKEPLLEGSGQSRRVGLGGLLQSLHPTQHPLHLLGGGSPATGALGDLDSPAAGTEGARCYPELRPRGGGA